MSIIATLKNPKIAQCRKGQLDPRAFERARLALGLLSGNVVLPMPVIISPSRARCGLARTASSGSSRSSVELGAPGSVPTTPAQKLCTAIFQPSSPPVSDATHGPLSALAVAYESDGEDGFVSAEEASENGGTPCSAAKLSLTHTSSSPATAATPSKDRPPPSFLANCSRCKFASPVPTLLQRFDAATLQRFDEAREPVPHLSSVLRAFVGEIKPEIKPEASLSERLALMGPAPEATSLVPGEEPLTAPFGAGSAEPPPAELMESPASSQRAESGTTAVASPRDNASRELTPDGVSALLDVDPPAAAPGAGAAESARPLLMASPVLVARRARNRPDRPRQRARGRPCARVCGIAGDVFLWQHVPFMHSAARGPTALVVR